MILVAILQLSVVITLIVTSRKRLQDAVPFFCFFATLMPIECKFAIPGLFDLSTQRVALATLLVLFIARGQRVQVPSIPLKYLMLMHVLWASISTVYSLSVVTSVKQLISQVIEYYLLYYILLRTVSDVKVVYRTVFAMVMAMALCSSFGLLEAYANWSVLSVFPRNLWVDYGSMGHLNIDPGRGLRIASTFPHPILFGDALAMAIPLALYLATVWKVNWQRQLLRFSVLLMLWALYRTLSRGPWLALAMSAILMLLMMQQRMRKYLAVVALLGVLSVLARPGVRDTLSSLWDATFDPTSVSGSSYQYRYALMDAITHRLGKDAGREALGYGLGTFREIGLDIYFLNRVQRWTTCDNMWALFLYETGYVGLLLMIGLLFSPLWMAVRDYRRLPKPEAYFSGMVFIVLAGFYFMLYSVAGYSWGQPGYMVWILIALSVIYGRLVRRGMQRDAKVASLLRLQAADCSLPSDTAPVPARWE
jgi:hypothetical protein